jgi:PAS domain S-box-containing protein
LTPTPLSNRDAALFHNAFHYAPIGMALVGLDGRFMVANASAFAMLGYTEDELYAKSYKEITHPEDLEQDNAYVQQLLDGDIDSYQMEKRYFHKNGEVIHSLLTVSLVCDEQGEPLHFISQLVDVTETVKNKQQLTALNKRIADTLESISDAFYTIDHNYRFIYANQAAKQFFRIDEQQLIGRIIWEVFPSLIGTTSQQQLTIASSSKQPVQFEDYILPYNQWFEVKAYPSEFGLSVHSHNITERKRTADKLLESEKSFRLLAENSSDIISKHTMDGITTYISPACYPLLQGCRINRQISLLVVSSR